MVSIGIEYLNQPVKIFSDFLRMKKLAYIFLFLSNAHFVKGQLPSTDVYLADFKNMSSLPQIQTLKYLSNFNPKGYNNQAKLFSYDEIYLTVAQDTSKFTDIYQLNLKSNEISRFTNTEKISEFSPSPSLVPGQLTTVRIENDGVDQSLWSYPVDRSGHGSRLLPQLKNIGYYNWINKDTIALFLVGNPNTLAIANIKSGIVSTLAENVGRCIKSDQSGHLFFVHKLKTDSWMLKSYQFSDQAIVNICLMPQGREDFELLPNGNMITGDGPLLKLYNPSNNKGWTAFADFTHNGITNINRLSIYRDRLVFINVK